MPLLGQIFRQGLFDNPVCATSASEAGAVGQAGRPFSHSIYMGTFG